FFYRGWKARECGGKRFAYNSGGGAACGEPHTACDSHGTCLAGDCMPGTNSGNPPDNPPNNTDTSQDQSGQDQSQDPSSQQQPPGDGPPPDAPPPGAHHQTPSSLRFGVAIQWRWNFPSYGQRFRKRDNTAGEGGG